MRHMQPSCMTNIEGTDIIEELHSKDERWERKEVAKLSNLSETNLLGHKKKIKEKSDTKSYQNR